MVGRRTIAVKRIPLAPFKVDPEILGTSVVEVVLNVLIHLLTEISEVLSSFRGCREHYRPSALLNLGYGWGLSRGLPVYTCPLLWIRVE